MIYYKDSDSRRFRDTSRYLPKGINLNIIDYGRMRKIDRFYCLCQEHRDFYKDHSNQLRCIPFFQQNNKKYESKETPTNEFMRQKPTYLTVAQPILYTKLI